MAVARPELMLTEIDWVIKVCEGAGPPPIEAKRAIRELRRSRDNGKAIEARERAQVTANRRAQADTLERRQAAGILPQ